MTATRYYEDLETGETFESGTKRVTKDEALAFARRYDPQHFHADEEAARDSVFGEVVASGIHTMAMWRQLDHQIAADIAWICGVAWDDVRFPRAVRPGDTLRARATCPDKRLSRKDPERGAVVYCYELFNQRDEILFEYVSTTLVSRRR